LIAELHASDRRASDLARGLTSEQLNWRREPGTWSIGQCLHHLHMANKVYLPPIAVALHDRRPSPVEEITPGWFGRSFIRMYIEPESRGRRQAPGTIAPAPQVDTSVLDEFLKGNDVARDLVRKAAAYDVNRLRFKNPFVPLLRFTVGTGFEIISRHQRRHLLQAERIRQAPTFPAR
jgi:hypothetical protein